MTEFATKTERIDWVDYAKGICIILVVMMHSTLGVEKAMGQTGYLSAFIEWARPFRMPDFFVISGLFLSRRIATPWRSYFDSKVLHFAYFYVLWMTLQFAFKGPGLLAEHGPAFVAREYALGFVEPFGTLWFIYLLAIFFVVTKVLQDVPRWMVFAAAAALEILPIHTGWLVVDEFSARYVYFFAGFWLAPKILSFAGELFIKPAMVVLAMLYIWATAHSAVMIWGGANLPFVSLALGFAGALAVIATAVMLTRSNSVPFMAYLGANSIVVYLAFFLFMATTRSLALKLIPDVNVDVLAAATTFAGVLGPVLLFWAVRHTSLGLLFKRPAWARLKPVETRAKDWHIVSHDLTSFKQPQAR